MSVHQLELVVEYNASSVAQEIDFGRRLKISYHVIRAAHFTTYAHEPLGK